MINFTSLWQKSMDDARKTRIQMQFQQIQQILQILQIQQAASKRKNFTPQEDLKLFNIVNRVGESHWRTVAKEMEERTARRCREHWINSLNLNLKQDSFTEVEHRIIHEKYELFGPKWHRIAKFLKHCSPDSIKNEFRRLGKFDTKSNLMSILTLCNDSIGRIPPPTEEELFQNGFMSEDDPIVSWTLDDDLA
jgi:hypothetical protein